MAEWSIAAASKPVCFVGSNPTRLTTTGILILRVELVILIMISINKWIITVNLETIATIESMMNG